MPSHRPSVPRQLITATKFGGGNLSATKCEGSLFLSTIMCYVLVTQYLGIHSTSLTRPLTITLVRASQFGLNYHIASYILDSLDDCFATRRVFPFYCDFHHPILIIILCSAVVLLPLNHSLETGLPIRLVLTVSGNPNYNHKNDISTLGQGPSNQYWVRLPIVDRMEIFEMRIWSWQILCWRFSPRLPAPGSRAPELLDSS